MNYSTKIIKSKAKNIVGLISVEKFNLANPWSLTLARLPRAGANAKLHVSNEIIENEGLSENMGFNGETV